MGYSSIQSESGPHENYVFARPTIKFNQSIKMCERKTEEMEMEWVRIFKWCEWRFARLSPPSAFSFARYVQWTPRKSNFVIHLNHTPFHAFHLWFSFALCTFFSVFFGSHSSILYCWYESDLINLYEPIERCMYSVHRIWKLWCDVMTIHIGTLTTQITR